MAVCCSTRRPARFSGGAALTIIVGSSVIAGSSAQAADSCRIDRVAARADTPAVQRIRRIQESIVPPAPLPGEPARTTLEDRMRALQVHGVSIAMIHSGNIEWACGFGVARINGSPVSPKTLFQAASISKPVTALATLHLVESGRLDLEVDVSQYLRTWKIPWDRPDERSKVTLAISSPTISATGWSSWPMQTRTPAS